jgi:putative transposase
MAARAFTYLLQPTVRQSVALAELFEVQRELYNAALDERRGAWRWERRRVTRFDQYMTLTGLREVRPEALRFGVTVCRGTLTRLDRAFVAFFRRVRAGQAPGFPRFKGRGRFDSVEYPDTSGWKLDEPAKRLYLQGVGHIRLRLHRPLRGEAKTATVRREGRRFRVTVFCVGVPARPLPPTGRAVGLDVGVANLVATSDGELVPNPRHLGRAAERLAAAQAGLARHRRGSGRRRCARERVAALHRKVSRQRRNHLHQLSRRLVDGYDLIAVEALKVKNMSRSAKGTLEAPGTHVAAKAGLNRSILDAGWGTLVSMLAYKAEDAGRQLVRVDPRHTSVTCVACGNRDPANRLNQAEFRCRRCGHYAHADINAARNILRAGLAQRHDAQSAYASRGQALTLDR